MITVARRSLGIESRGRYYLALIEKINMGGAADWDSNDRPGRLKQQEGK